MEMVEGSSTVHEVEGVVFAEAATTTEVVVELEAKMAKVAAEASDHGGEAFDHHAGKEVVANFSPDP